VTQFSMRNMGRHGAIYGIGVVLSKAVAFVMLPIYTRYLTPSDYGILQLATITIEVVSIVAGSRLASGVFRYYFKATTDSERRSVLATSLGMLVACYSGAALLTIGAAPAIAKLVFGSPEQARLIRIAAGGLAFEGWLVVPLTYLRIKDRSTRFVLISTTKLGLQLSMNILFVVYWKLAAEGVLLSTMIANFAMGTVLGIALLRETGFRVSRGVIVDLLRFGLPLVGTQIATFVSTFGDRFFLQRAADASAVGVYGLAYDFGFLLVALGFNPFNTVWEPLRYKVANDPQRDQIYGRAFVHLNLLLITMSLGITLFVGDALRILATPGFYSAAHIVPFVLIAYVLQSWTGFLNIGIMMTERTGYITVANWVAAGVAVVSYVLLIPSLLGIGAALATIAAFLVRHLIIYVASQRLWPVRYSWSPIWRLLALAGVIGGISVFLPNASLAQSLAERSGLLLLFALGILGLRILPEADRATMSALVQNWRTNLRLRPQRA
jgi:O-antigen/teichoic acid export membrane protein